jgi:kynureninase
MRIFINKICKDKDRFLNEIKIDFQKICKCSFKFLKNGDGSSTAMLILQQNLKKQVIKYIFSLNIKFHYIS